jgi:hypothetical protein
VSACEGDGDRDFEKKCPRPPHVISTRLQRRAQRKVLSHSDALEISLIGTSCMRPTHQSCRPETGRLHVQSFAPIVSVSSLGECALVAVNKRDVHRVEQATSEVKPQDARCIVSSYMHSLVSIQVLKRLFLDLMFAWLAERIRITHGVFQCMSYQRDCDCVSPAVIISRQHEADQG